MERRGGGSILTLTYLGSQRVFHELQRDGRGEGGARSRRCGIWRPISARRTSASTRSPPGPIKTLAAAGISGFSSILQVYRERAPLRRNVELAEVADAAVFLLEPGVARDHRRNPDGRCRVPISGAAYRQGSRFRTQHPEPRTPLATPFPYSRAMVPTTRALFPFALAGLRPPAADLRQRAARGRDRRHRRRHDHRAREDGCCSTITQVGAIEDRRRRPLSGIVTMSGIGEVGGGRGPRDSSWRAADDRREGSEVDAPGRA